MRGVDRELERVADRSRLAIVAAHLARALDEIHVAGRRDGDGQRVFRRAREHRAAQVRLRRRQVRRRASLRPAREREREQDE